jgi:hypothetical protein
LAIALLAAAGINVLISIGCAMRLSTPVFSMQPHAARLDEIAVPEKLQQMGVVLSSVYEYVYRRPGGSVTKRQYNIIRRPIAGRGGTDAYPLGVVEIRQVGFPFYAFVGTRRMIEKPFKDESTTDGIADCFGWAIPFGINGMAFVGNTLCYYAAVLVMTFVPGYLRRSYRVRYGRCSNCGYILYGLNRCPECNCAN